jgi:hypothetical protein
MKVHAVALIVAMAGCGNDEECDQARQEAVHGIGAGLALLRSDMQVLDDDIETGKVRRALDDTERARVDARLARLDTTRNCDELLQLTGLTTIHSLNDNLPLEVSEVLLELARTIDTERCDAIRDGIAKATQDLAAQWQIVFDRDDAFIAGLTARRAVYAGEEATLLIWADAVKANRSVTDIVPFTSRISTETPMKTYQAACH